MELTLDIKLRSDATFGRGDGVAGLVDTEIEHDPATGLPLIRGRTVKGLLVETCSEILYSLARAGASGQTRLEGAAERLFGSPGSLEDDQGGLRVGPARFPDELRNAVAHAIAQQALTATEALESLTAVRRQTAMTEHGAPATGSLRSVRVLLHDATLTARLRLETSTDGDDRADELALLDACVKGLRRGGLSRNRGRGRLEVSLAGDGYDEATAWARFAALARKGVPG